MTISAKEFEEGLAKREVREITRHTQAVDLAESDRAQIAALADRLHALEDTLRDVGALALKASDDQERSAMQLVELRRNVAESLDDTIITVARELNIPVAEEPER